MDMILFARLPLAACRFLRLLGLRIADGVIAGMVFFQGFPACIPLFSGG